MATNQGEPAVISRFADPRQTKTIDLGGGDSAEVRSDIGDGEARAASIRGGYRRGEEFNGADSDDEFIGTFVLSWTLKDPDGNPAPVTAEMASRLDGSTRSMLLAAIVASSSARRESLPNASGGRSRGGTRATASRNRAPART